MDLVVCLFGSYAAVSTFFYYFPHLIYKKKDKHKRFEPITVLSHRGGLAEQNENTLAAFDHSHKIGVDMVELDCHLTKDGHVVVCHDNNLERSAGVNINISDLNFKDLPSLLETTSSIFLPDGDIRRPLVENSSDLTHSTRIPLLEEIFEKYPDLPINLDIKVDNDELIKKVNDLIIKFNREHITVWGSFKEEVLRKCHKLNDNIGSYFSLQGCVRLFFLNMTGLLPFVTFKETHFEVIMPNHVLKHKRNQLSWGFYFALWIVKICFMRKSFINHLRKRGILVYLWVLNTEEEFKYAIDTLGIDGIITDYPTKLIEFLKQNYEFESKTRFPRKQIEK